MSIFNKIGDAANYTSSDRSEKSTQTTWNTTLNNAMSVTAKSSPTAEQTTNRIKEIINSKNILFPSPSSQFLANELKTILESSDAETVKQIINNLNDDELNRLARSLGQLTDGRRNGLFWKLAEKLNGDQLARLTKAVRYYSGEDFQRLAYAVGKMNPSSSEKIKYINAMGLNSPSPDGLEILAHINLLLGAQGKEPVFYSSISLANPFLSLSDKERQFYGATLGELDKIVLNKDPLASRDYMFNVMQHAADIAGNDRGLFVDLVHQGFNQPPMGYTEVRGRSLAGGGLSKTGFWLESIYQNSAPKGSTFNPLIVDSQDPNNSITHHFGEFLAVGASHNPMPWRTVRHMDNPTENPGDVRSGYFAVMLGQALEDGKITPQQAVDLTRWAYSGNSDGKAPPPWGNTRQDVIADNNKVHSDGGFAGNTGKYDIESWLFTYYVVIPIL